MKKIKVLYVSSWHNSIYHELFSHLDKDIDLTLALSVSYPSSYTSKQYSTQYFPTTRINKLYNFMNKPDTNVLPIYTSQLKKFIKKEKPDVIITNLIYLPSTIQLANWCKKLSIPFILQTEMKMKPSKLLSRAMYFILKKLFFKKIVRNSTSIISWIKDSEEFFRKEYSLTASSIQTIPPGINTRLFQPQENTKKGKTLQLLMIARLTPYKNHRDVIELAKQLRDENILFNIHFLGKGPLKQHLKSDIKKCGLTKHISFLDFVPAHKVPNIINQHDALLLPSTNEAIGMVVPEAMSCGLPVIISDTTGAKMYVDSGMNGLMFQTNNISDLKKQVLLLKDVELRQQIGKKASKHIRNTYTLEKIGKRYSQAIKSTLT